MIQFLNLLIVLFTGFVVFKVFFLGLETLYYYFKNRSIIKSLTPQKVDKSKLCKGPHPWMSAPLDTGNGPEKSIPVCRACGLISGTETMMSQEAIDSIESNKKMRTLEKRLYKEFLDREDGDIKKYFAKEIEGGVSLDKLLHLHSAGITFSQRYAMYKVSKAKDIEKELTKSDA